MGRENKKRRRFQKFPPRSSGPQWPPLAWTSAAGGQAGIEENSTGKKRHSKSHGRCSAEGCATAGGTPPCRAIAGGAWGPGGFWGVWPWGRRQSGRSGLGSAQTSGKPATFLLPLFAFFSPPPPPKAANCPCQQKGSQLCKKRDVKNPTRTPLFYCAFPRFKANPNPKLFYSGGVLMFIAERVRRYSIISLQHPPYMQPRRGGVQKSLNPLSYSFIFVLKKDGG